MDSPYSKTITSKDDKNDGTIKYSVQHFISDLISKNIPVGSSKHYHVYKLLRDAVEIEIIVDVLKRTHGNNVRAAIVLGINRNTLRKQLKRLKIDYKYFVLNH